MGWKIFFWIYSILTLLSFFDLPSHPTLLDQIGLPFTVVELLALYSYAYKKDLFDKKYWKMLVNAYVGFFIVFGLAELTPLGAMLPMLKSSQFMGMPTEQKIAALMVTLVFFIPNVYAMYKVAYTKLSAPAKTAAPKPAAKKSPKKPAKKKS